MTVDPTIARLTELALVDLDALTEGLPDGAELLLAHGAELDDALAAARALAASLVAKVAGDPLRWLDAPGALVAGDAPLGAARAAERLAQRSAAAVELARLDQAAAPLVAIRVALARRTASSG